MNLIFRKLLNADLLPFFMKCINWTRNCLVRSCTVHNIHEDITIFNSHHSFLKHWYVIAEAWIRFKSLCTQWDYRNIWNTSLYECSSDESNIVGSTASTTCLWHNHSSSWKVVFAWKKGVHNLSDYHKWRVACVVINIFKTYIYWWFVVVLKDFNIVATWIKGRT